MHSVTSNAVAKKMIPVMTTKFPSGITANTATFLNLLTDGTVSTACCGSVDLTDGPIGDTWYNYLYIPHRNGIDVDSFAYGTLLLTTMVHNHFAIWLNHKINGIWYGFGTV